MMRETHQELNVLAPVEDRIERYLTSRYDRPTRVTEIAGAVCLEIIKGELAAGVELNSVKLADRFMSSRTPVREALMLLEKEGLVDLPPRRRPIVAEASAQDIRDNYELRMILMPEVMKRVVINASFQEISDLECSFLGMKKAAQTTDVDAYFWANVAFHDLLAQIARQNAIRSVIEGTFLRSLRFRRFGMALPGRVARSCEDHQFLMRALSERDGELASSIIKSNIAGALKAIQSQP